MNGFWFVDMNHLKLFSACVRIKPSCGRCSRGVMNVGAVAIRIDLHADESRSALSALYSCMFGHTTFLLIICVSLAVSEPGLI